MSDVTREEFDAPSFTESPSWNTPPRVMRTRSSARADELRRRLPPSDTDDET